MTGGPRIAIDAMGGDTGPAAMIAGRARARRKDSSLQFTFYGDEARSRRARQASGLLACESHIVHSPEAIAASEKPSQAIRRAADDLDGHGDQRREGRPGRRRRCPAATPAR